MFQACFDYSGRDTDSPCFLIAGYLGSADDFVDLSHGWAQLLAKDPKLNYIKGYEAFGLSGEFIDWTIEERDRRLLDSCL
jgi:hypothetical protein